MIIGRKPKLTPEQQADLAAWATSRRITRRQKARDLGIAESTLGRYLRLDQKQPIRRETA